MHPSPNRSSESSSALTDCFRLGRLSLRKEKRDGATEVKLTFRAQTLQRPKQTRNAVCPCISQVSMRFEIENLGNSDIEFLMLEAWARQSNAFTILGVDDLLRLS